jgi:phospholipid/cholesterol/gamma-HCH transport system permease protein
VSPSVASRVAARDGFVAYIGRRSLETARALADVQTWGPLLIGQMRRLGVDSVPIALFIAVFTGIVLSLLSSYIFTGAVPMYFVGTLVGKTVMMELGPVLTGMALAGRVGASIAAEIGTMKVTEQIDALRSMAADPVKKLVAPKLVATLVMLPALTIIGDALGILGGLIVAVGTLNLTPGLYLNDVFESLTIGDVCSGIGKSFFFAYFIAIIGCYNGLNTTGGADGVGRATTNTVVLAAILVLVSDFFLTKLFYLLVA